jgi:sugar phosphate isomerase/epimerase
MQLAISNLTLPDGLEPEMLKGIRDAGVDGIEVAPTRIAAWADLSESRLTEYRTRLAEHGLVVSSLASLVFGTEGLQLLGSHAAFEKLREHLRRVANIGQRLGATVGVFGSPRNRLRGALQPEAAFSLGRDRFAMLAETVSTEGFRLGLEPVPAAYGGDFLPQSSDVIEMVRQVNHAGLRVHLDTGCALLGGESIAEAVAEADGTLAHFHIAEPKLAAFGSPTAEHTAAAGALRAAAYDGWLVIEMLQQTPDSVTPIFAAVHFAKTCYFPAVLR